MNIEDQNKTLIHNEISLIEIIYTIKKHRTLILIIIFFSLILSLTYNYLKSSVYQSHGTIMIEDTSSSTDIFDMGMGLEKNYIENEIEILRSRTTSERAIRKLLDEGYKNNLYILGKKGVGNKVKNLFYNNKRSNNNTIISDSLFNIVTNNLRQRTTVSHIRNTDILKISVKSYDPHEATLLVNTLIDVYKEIDLEWATGEMFNLKTFLKEQIELKENDLSKSERLLRNFQEEETIFTLDDKSQLLLENLIDSESNLYNSKAQSSILDERIKYIQNQLSSEEKKLAENITDTINDRLIALKNEIAIKEAELISSINQQGEDHTVVVQLKNKIKKLKEKLGIETRSFINKGISVTDPIKFRQSLMDSLITIKSTVAILEAKEIEYLKLVKEYENQLSDLPEKVLKFARLTRNLNIDTETYSLMRQKLEEARINEASKIGKVRIVDAAYPNLEKVEPKEILNLVIGLILGGLISLFLIALIEYLDNTINSIDEIDKRGLTLLALIPSIGNPHNKNKKSIKYQKKLGNAEKIQRRMVTLEDPKSPVSEAYRTLRTSLMYSNKQENNVILVSSPGPGEGKTTTIVNLAMTYANLGKKTILLDCDLRKPVTHKIFSIDKEPGISKYLSGIENDISKIIRPSEIENLSTITCGIVPPNPSEILSSKNMENLIEDLKNKFDIILIDSPPLLAVTDAFVCMKHVNQFIMVVRFGKTEKGGLDRSIDQLRQTNSPLTGVILNDVNESNSYGKGYYYNYYQYYYADNNKS